jgi:hypothetical protein
VTPGIQLKPCHTLLPLTQGAYRKVRRPNCFTLPLDIPQGVALPGRNSKGSEPAHL